MQASDACRLGVGEQAPHQRLADAAVLPFVGHDDAEFRDLATDRALRHRDHFPLDEPPEVEIARIHGKRSALELARCKLADRREEALETGLRREAADRKSVV